MHDIHFDTIAAPATGSGESGIAIIRISGPDALLLLQRTVVLRHAPHDWTPRRLYYGLFCDSHGDPIDEVMAVYFPAPHSFTGDECGEIHCHGGRVVVRRLLDTLIASGARLADPGEFTRRAFLNGRIDLSRAEAVADIIHARSEVSRRVALSQLQGSLYRQIEDLSEQVTQLLALVEAHIDFPEDDIRPPDLRHTQDTTAQLHREIGRLIDGYDEGRILRDGAALLILGRPNVGKSSLLNALVGEDRAIVSDLPGTTRDTVEEAIVLAGLPMRIIDSAGIRPSDDQIENQGIRRALNKLANADLVLLVFDGSCGFTTEDAAVYAQCSGRPVLLIRNKSDLPAAGPPPPADLPLLSLSCQTGSGLQELPQRIETILAPHGHSLPDQQPLICDLRHKEALLTARGSLGSFLRLLGEGAPLELCAYELRDALNALGQITGKTTPDEILDRIFARFCIGK